MLPVSSTQPMVTAAASAPSMILAYTGLSKFGMIRPNASIRERRRLRAVAFGR